MAEFEKRPQPKLRETYRDAHLENSVDYATEWQGWAPLKDFEFRLSSSRFSLPEKLQAVKDALVEFQTGGRATDNPTARLARIEYLPTGGKVLTFERASYFDYIATNHAMDTFIAGYDATVREMIEPGPNLTPFSEAQAANHLGLVCVVETADSKLIMQRKGGNSVTGANSMHVAASAAMNLREPFQNPFQVMQNELFEEAALTPDETASIQAIAVGRELARGGKPELFFHLFVPSEAAEIVARKITDPDKEIDTRPVIQLPKDPEDRIQELHKLIADPRIFASSKAALNYYAARLWASTAT
jgi:hypothetical protein